jgi:integrase
MSSRTTFALYFYINGARIRRNGECPLYARISINSKRLTIYTKRNIKLELWDAGKGMAIGNSKEAREFNSFVEVYRAMVYNKYTKLLAEFEEVTLELMSDAIQGTGSSQSKTLCDIWEEQVKVLKALIGKDSSYGNYQKYATDLKYMRQFLQEEYKIDDIPIKLVNRQLVVKFDIFLKTKKQCSYNTATKYLQIFKRIVMIGIRNGWSKINPFDDFKLGFKEVDRPYLTEDELRRIMELEILIPRLEVVRDLFIFACFSGLSYSDILKLKGSELERDPKGVLWIKTRRQKTKVTAQIPLLQIPTAIIDKYCDLSVITAEQKVLPVMSNQKLNSYLKELQMSAKIEKLLTFHVARHTFATTVTMLNGVPIESVARMLGHKNIKTTQHYARIVDSKIGNDMRDLAGKIGERFELSQLSRITQ